MRKKYRNGILLGASTIIPTVYVIYSYWTEPLSAIILAIITVLIANGLIWLTAWGFAAANYKMLFPDKFRERLEATAQIIRAIYSNYEYLKNMSSVPGYLETSYNGQLTVPIQIGSKKEKIRVYFENGISEKRYRFSITINEKEYKGAYKTQTFSEDIDNSRLLEDPELFDLFYPELLKLNGNLYELCNK